MPNLINTPSQMRDLLALFGDRKLMYDGPVLNLNEQKNKADYAARSYTAKTKDFFSSAEIENLNELLKTLIDELNRKRAERRESHITLRRPDFDYELNVPFENWMIYVYFNLCRIEHHSNEDPSVYFSLTTTIEFSIDQPDMSYRETIQSYYKYEDDINEQNLLSQFASSRLDTVQHLDSLYESIRAKLTSLQNDSDSAFLRLDANVQKYASLTKFIMADRDF